MSESLYTQSDVHVHLHTVAFSYPDLKYVDWIVTAQLKCFAWTVRSIRVLEWSSVLSDLII